MVLRRIEVHVVGHREWQDRGHVSEGYQQRLDCRAEAFVDKPLRDCSTYLGPHLRTGSEKRIEHGAREMPFQVWPKSLGCGSHRQYEVADTYSGLRRGGLLRDGAVRQGLDSERILGRQAKPAHGAGTRSRATRSSSGS